MASDPAKLKDRVVLMSGYKDRIGTGFVIHSDSEFSYVVTCYHVIADADETELRVNNSPTKLIAFDKTKGGFDLAVLRVERDSGHSTFGPGGLGYRAGMKFESAGYSDNAKLNSAQEVGGTLGAEKTIYSQGLDKRMIGWDLVPRNGHKLRDGHSGAPAVDQKGNVFAVVTTEHEASATGFAISIEALLHIWPDMPFELRVQLSAKPRGKYISVTSGTGMFPLMNCDDELENFYQIIRGEDLVTKLITVHGQSGYGKTRLLDEYEALCREESIPYKRWKLGVGLPIQPHEILDAIAYHYGISYFSQYNTIRKNTTLMTDRWFADLTHSLVEDFNTIDESPSLVLLFDQYERADWLVKTFIEQALLTRLEHLPLVTIIAGQEELPVSVSMGPDMRHNIPLKGVSVEEYLEFAQGRGYEVEIAEITKLHKALQGQPKLFAEYVEAEKQVHHA